MKKNLAARLCLLLTVFASFATFNINAQTVLIDHHFNVSGLPTGITSDGVISPTKAADGVCSQGMIQVNSGGYLQVSMASCGTMTVNMKSTSSSTRLLTVKYKKDGEAAFTNVTTSLAVSVAASYNFTTLFPALVSAVPIIIRIEPTSGNIQIHDLYLASNAVQSAAAEITAFKLNGQIGAEVINSAAGTVSISVPLGTLLTSVVPSSISISSQATINPLASAAQNFTSPVVYTVTAQNGSTKTWMVTVTPVASSAKEITDFKLANTQIGAAVINTTNATIAVTMPTGSNLASIIPTTITVSLDANILPLPTAPQNFTVPVNYTVTAQDNSTKTWTVTVTLIDPNAVFTDYEAENADFTGTVDTNNAGFTGAGFINFLPSGDNSIVFKVCQKQTGNQTAKFRYSLANDTYRKGRLFVNDNFVQLLDFARTATFTEWKEETVTLNLLSGLNNIKITWDTTDGPNLDKLMLTGAVCSSYQLTITTTNGGLVTKSPARNNNTYFENETVTLLAQTSAALKFDNWSGSLTGNTNPSTITITENKNIVANFSAVPTYQLTTSVNGIGSVTLSPSGGNYAENTVVTVTANTVLGSVFTGWSGHLNGTNAVQTITMTGNKNVTAAFSSTYVLDFDKVVGFASINGDGFTGPTKGGQCAADTLFINGPTEFNKLCEALYNRQRAYKNNVTTGGMKKAPLVIFLKAGVYDGSQVLSTDGSKVFGNSMLDIPEQGDLSFVGDVNVVFKIGINVKRSYNLLIRNISFQDYYDDGINIGYPETHHIWIDHCTLGHPTTFPADTEHPDGGCDVKDGASYVTISWCLFRNSWKTGLVGHSDNNGATDSGRLKVSFVNNHYLHTNSRNPRVRFGEVHVLNNLLENVQLYGSVAANKAQVYAENNFYLNTDWPMYADRSVADFKAIFGNNSDGTYTSKTGNYPALGLKQVGNAYDDSGLPVITAQINPAMLNPGGRSIKFDELNANSVFNPASYYQYTPFTPQEVRVIVPLFAGADKVQFSNCAVLPLQFLTFNASITTQQTARLIWQTTNEINTQHFVIQRSNNGNDFAAIGTLASANRSGVNSYAFDDTNPLSGIAYYRLQQVDKDGRFTHSSIVSVNNNRTASIATYPNPASNSIVIAHPKALVDATIEIVSVLGKKMAIINLAAGVSITNANIANLPAGNYAIVMQNGMEKFIVRFLKQ